MENIQTRRALQSAFYLLFNDLRWYQRRGGKNQLRAVLSAWVRMMSPFTPHVCEELWAAGLGEGYASLAEWPVADESLIDEQAEKAEDLLERTLNDVQEIVNVTKAKPGKITLYTTPAWKQEMLRLAVEAAAGRQAGHGRAHEGRPWPRLRLRSTRRMRPSMPRSWPRRPTRSRRRRWGWTSSRRLTREKAYLAGGAGRAGGGLLGG